MNIRRIGRLIVAVAMCISLTACGVSIGESVTHQYVSDATSNEVLAAQEDGGTLRASETTLFETSAQPSPTDPPAPTAPPSTLTVRFIDVGQADAALLECDGHFMLIDGGNKADSQIIYTVLKNSGATHLDLVVGTHAHEDHIGGIPGAFNYADADVTLCPVTSYDSDAFRDFARYAEQKGNGITVPSSGDTYSLGGSTVTILGLNEGTDTNNSSIVLRVDLGDVSFLFTGDAERPEEQMLLNAGVRLDATVLKVGHHGSDTSTTYPFLREIMPKVAVIPVGAGNSYGHPDDNALSRLRDADVDVYRTDLQGDIVITTDGTDLSIRTERLASREELLTAGKIVQVKSTSAPVVSGSTGGNSAGGSGSAGGTDYVANKNTGKFHYPDCSSVKQMKESNKLYFNGTREELIKKGYDPCKKCNP